MRTTPRLLAALLALGASTAARADVIEASSTTLFTAGQQTRGGAPGAKPDLATVTPLYEIVNVSARQVRNPLFQDLEFVLSGWGAYDLGDVRWDAGTTGHGTGDLQTGYVRGQLFDRAVALRAGRAFVTAGAGRMLQLDGGDLLMRLPGGVSVAAFAGSPVSQRFTTRDGLKSWNPAGGDLAYGGRVGWSIGFPGAYGRGLDVGASAVVVEKSGDPVRQDAGLDLRLKPLAAVVFTANGTYSIYAGKVAEGAVGVLWDATKHLFVNADFRYARPDLFLSRASILSVFTDTDRKEIGGGVRYHLTEALLVGADYHALLEPGEEGKTELGHDAAARAEWEHGETSLGVEASVLRTDNTLANKKGGYVGGRLFGRRELGQAFVTADVTAHQLTVEVNGHKSAVTGTLAAGYRITPLWSAVLAGRAGVTPFLEQQADLMVKLVYNQTYRAREVK
ncbi:MAG TPA: hypothetical protein VFP50_11820 [Anaeromyxobacteraceae bacterium]|nr:hypothetical protein [Anaeromyxobacteraceae bacterium]